MGSFFQHIPLEATTQDTTFSAALVAQARASGGAEKCCRLVDIFQELQVPGGASGALDSPRPEGLSRTPARKQLSPAGQ